MSISSLKYCLPIIKNATQWVLEAIHSAPSDYQIIEIWLDYIDDLSVQNLRQIINSGQDRTLLFLFRRQNFEPIRLSPDKRKAYMNELPKTAWLDLDIKHQSAELEYRNSQRSDLPLIASYHNYQATPSIEELKTLAAEMQTLNADILKFSTFCRTEQDALRLMSLCLALRESQSRFTVLGMGQMGKITRIIGPLLGSEIAYAPQDVAHSSAPGQLTLKQLNTIFKELHS